MASTETKANKQSLRNRSSEEPKTSRYFYFNAREGVCERRSVKTTEETDQCIGNGVLILNNNIQICLI